MEKHEVKWQYQDIDYTFHTVDSLFSYRQIDRGTIQMIERTEVHPNSKVLDLGCGYGVVGIWVARKIGAEHVVMSDVNIVALEMTTENIKLNNLTEIKTIHSNGFENVEESNFDLIMSNPPYHTDFSVAKQFIEGSYKHLRMGGRLVMVTKRFAWYKNKIESVFGGVKWENSDGYYIFTAQKRDIKKRILPKRKMSKKLTRKYEKWNKKIEKK